MDFIKITKSTGFYNPIFGNGELVQGNIYYTFSEFAQETTKNGLSEILRYQKLDVPPLQISTLNAPHRVKKVLCYFTGGLGDGITVGTVFPQVEKQYGITFDICTDIAKWEAVFAPMGMKGNYVSYPPDLDTISHYDAIATDITAFYFPERDLRISPILQLCRGFHIDPKDLNPGYFVSVAFEKQGVLPSNGVVRIGVSFESAGSVKAYPQALQEELLRTLTRLGFEVYLFGTDGSSPAHYRLEGMTDFRGKTTVAELAVLMKQMDLFLGVDSFAAHLANLMQVPTLVLLASTVSSSFEWHKYISCLESRIPCAPCFAVSNTCPAGHHMCQAFFHNSMDIDVILHRVQQRLAELFYKTLENRKTVDLHTTRKDKR